MNLSYLYLLHSQPSVVRGLWEGRFDSKVVGTQVGSEAHQEPSPQRRFFLLGGALTYFMLPTSPAPWKGIWQHHTFLLNHQDWLNQRVGFLPPPKIMSRSPQSQGSSLRKSWWWRYPKAEAGGSSGHVRRHERVGGSRCHVTAAIAPSSARESVVRCRGGWRRRVELLRSAVCSCLPEYQRREW